MVSLTRHGPLRMISSPILLLPIRRLISLASLAVLRQFTVRSAAASDCGWSPSSGGGSTGAKATAAATAATVSATKLCTFGTPVVRGAHLAGVQYRAGGRAGRGQRAGGEQPDREREPDLDRSVLRRAGARGRPLRGGLHRGPTRRVPRHDRTKGCGCIG